MNISLVEYNNAHLITFQFTFNPTITRQIKQFPGTEWYPELSSWGTRYSPFAAWLCLRTFTDPHAYRDDTYRRLQDSPQAIQPTLPRFLYKFQKEGASFLLARGNAWLCDRPGAGKTFQAIAAAMQFRSVIVLCPSSVKYSWQRDIMRANPSASVQVLKRIQQDIGPAQWTVLNPALLKSHLEKLLALNAECLVVDEAHVYRNHENKQTRSLMALATRVPHVFPLTGTPIYNVVADLFPLFVLTKKLHVHDYWWFIQRYCDGKRVSVKREGKTIFSVQANGLTHEQELRSFMSDFVLMRQYKDIGHELPPLTRETLQIEIDNREAYEKECYGVCAWLNEYASSAPRESRLIKINKLRNLAAMGKVWAVVERIKAAQDAGEKTVVICSFINPLRKIFQLVDGCIQIDGNVSDRQRFHFIEQFQTQRDCTVALCSMEAGGVSVTLTAARRAFILDIPWTPAQVKQAEARIYRISQTEPTIITYVVDEETVDTPMLSTIKRKARWTERLFEGGQDGYVDALEEIERYLLKGESHGSHGRRI